MAYDVIPTSNLDNRRADQGKKKKWCCTGPHLDSSKLLNQQRQKYRLQYNVIPSYCCRHWSLAGKADPGKTKSDAALAYSSTFDCACSRIHRFNSDASSSRTPSQQRDNDDTIQRHTILLPCVAWTAEQESRRPQTAFSSHYWNTWIDAYLRKIEQREECISGQKISSTQIKKEEK